MRRTRHSDDSRLFYDWLEIAARDLLAAKILIEGDQCLEIAGFHCQQCMEKTFKAYLIHTTGMLVDGHNLTWLCRQAQKRDDAFRRWMEETAEINRLYIETRYPSDLDMHVDGEEAARYYAAAESLYEYVCDIIYGEGEPDD